ncbi:MAG: hypothetical protein ACREN8_00755 [Candidatus Dormibacteraceae bacterium]
MAADLIRTTSDDADDALAALDAAVREVENWTAHLRQVKADPAPGVAMQARRSACVVTCSIADAAAHTRAIAARSLPDQQLSSVS